MSRTTNKSSKIAKESTDSPSAGDNTDDASPRIELFFSSLPQLRQRVQLFQSHGYSKFNLVNKNAQDPVLEWADIIRDECPTADICAHFSLKYNKVARQGNSAHAGQLLDFTEQAHGKANEVLVVSGGHSPSKPRPKWNTVDALETLVATDDLPAIAVAYNPYIPDAKLQQQENQRLQAKLDTGLVSKVYLQFGTDLVRLKAALDMLQSLKKSLAGSLFMPTKQLISQQKFRPWNGVHLSADFLSGPEPASNIVVEMIKLYAAYNVEVLWEAPGIRTDKDLALVHDLMVQAASSADKETKQQEEPTTRNGPATKRQKTLTELTSSCCILLFGAHDMRLYDNLAVQKACQDYATVIPTFLWSPSCIESGGIRAEAMQVLIEDIRNNLQQSLQSTFGLRLICRGCNTHADLQRELTSLVQETGATSVYFSQDFTPQGRQLQEVRAHALFPLGVQHKGFQSTLLYDIDRVSLSTGFHGGHWGTLMPFLKNCEKNHGKPRRPIPQRETFALLQKVQQPVSWPASDTTTIAVLTPKATDWHKPIRERFPNMSYEGAHQLLEAFFQANNSGFRRYESERSRADKELATSRLSAHLRLGTLSPNELYWKHHDHPMSDSDKKTFSRRLVWRDLAYYQLRCFPEMSSVPIRAHYQKSGWVTGAEEHRRLEAWKWGKTGYPIVDAGMRELYRTGWMTQSVRMVVASFLVEYLRVNWVKGCEFFHYTLVDCDTAINAMMWQNAGKCGIDQWNFVLSPENASQDPSGKYTKKWVPELAKLPSDLLHRPWQAPATILQRHGIVLGQTYPHRVVTNLKEERAKSVESTLDMRRASQDFNDSKGYDSVLLPNGDKTVVFTKKEYRIDGSGNVFPQHHQISKSQRSTSAAGRGQRGRRGRR